MAAIYETKKKRSRVGRYLACGAGVFMAAYLPSFALFPARIAPVLSTAAASFVLILIATRFRSLREGLVAGLILGLVAGIASLSANLFRVDNELRRTTPVPQETSETQPAPTTQDSTTSAPAENEETLTPEEREEAIRQLTAYRNQLIAYREQLPVLCILPHLLLGAVIGLIFARAAAKRQQQTQSPWQ